MALLAGVHYDPSTAATKATTALLAMTAIDTTNLRVTFTAPANGTVLVRMRCAVEGNANAPNILLGVLESSTVMGRQIPICAAMASAVSTRNMGEALFLVTGLSAGSSHTWDAAYGVQLAQTTSQIEYGGPNDTTTDNAWGGFTFEVWETTNLLAGVFVDPVTGVANSATSLLAMTAFDTTNLRLTFQAPESGRVMVRVRCVYTAGTSVAASILLGVLEGASVVARCAPMGGRTNLAAHQANCVVVLEGEMLITGLVNDSVHTYDAAYGVEIVGGGGTLIERGGPNDTTGTGFGGLAFEIWNAG